jgi:asparagine synthase (glutamine-hydrolysing)
MRKFFLSDHNATDAIDAMTQQTLYATNAINLNYTDKMSMAHGVEVRVPLLDQDLVALAARLPDGMKQRGRIGRRSRP